MSWYDKHYTIQLPKIVIDFRDFVEESHSIPTGFQDFVEKLHSIPLPWNRDFLEVSHKPLKYRKAAEKIAKFFRREFEYDCLQYTANEQDYWRRDYTKDKVFIWTTPTNYEEYKNTVIGAAVFRWREWKDAPAGYALAWVWFHPYERNKGHLKKAWPHFKKLFGDFHVEGPLSQAMVGFLKSVEDSVHKNTEVSSPLPKEVPV